jgi:hypothetical protein
MIGAANFHGEPDLETTWWPIHDPSVFSSRHVGIYAARRHGHNCLREVLMSRLARLASVAFGAMAALMLAGYDERPPVREHEQGRFRHKPDGSVVTMAPGSEDAAGAAKSISSPNQNENES